MWAWQLYKAAASFHGWFQAVRKATITRIVLHSAPPQGRLTVFCAWQIAKTLTNTIEESDQCPSRCFLVRRRKRTAGCESCVSCHPRRITENMHARKRAKD